MEWLASNWIWIALIVGVVALHRFGHGGHGYGGHGHHSHRREARGPEETQTGLSTAKSSSAASDQVGQARHRHGC